MFVVTDSSIHSALHNGWRTLAFGSTDRNIFVLF